MSVTRAAKKSTHSLSPRDWLFPVIRRVTGQEPVSLHESLGKSPNETKSVLTARNWGSGNCKTGGHSGGLGIEQVATCDKSEYWIPQTRSHWPSPFWSIQVQPHLFEGLSSSLLITTCSNTSNKQRTIGNNMSLRFVLIFLLWLNHKININTFINNLKFEIN